MQIGQGLRILLRAFNPERLQRQKRHHPGRDGCGEVLSQEGSERLILPALDISGAPVIDKNQAEDMVGRRFDRNRLAQRTAGSDEETHFKLKVQVA